VSSYSSSWRVELRRVFSCSTDRLESCHGRRGLNPTGGFTRSKKYLPTGELQRRQRRFPGAGYAFAGMRQVPIFGARSTKKEVWTMSTLSTSNWLVQPPDCPGFRMSPPLPSVPKPRNRLRVPPRARHTPSSEGFLLLSVYILFGQVPLTLAAECAWRRGSPVLLWGSGFRVVAGGPSACSELRLYVPLLVRSEGRGCPTPLHV
jgi:hypothetical protein